MNRIVLLLVLCYHVLSQPVTDEPSTRHARELIECCPCPSSRNAGVQDMLAGSQLAYGGSLDDCPCRARSADSEGASSMFFPSAVRAGGPVKSTNDSKEDVKNLLEPEVTLATSMLDTLREATEIEYRDALARDAARDAARSTARSTAETSDAFPEESARNVVIIVNPESNYENNDDFVSEATHVQESRCIHPLGTSLSRIRSNSKSTNLLPETLSFPKLKHPSLIQKNLLHMDSNLGASNVEENVMDINENTSTFQSRVPILKLSTTTKSIKDAESNDARIFRKVGSGFGQFNENEPSLANGQRFPLLTKLIPRKDIMSNNDLNPAPSNIQIQSELVDDKTNQLFKHAQSPLRLKNLLKLRDVELIPRTFQKPLTNHQKIDMTKFAIPSRLKINQNENQFKENCDKNVRSHIENNQDKIKTNTDPLKKVFRSFHQFEDSNSKLNQDMSIEFVSENAEDKKENLDSFSSPSQVQSSIVVSDIEKNIQSAESLGKQLSNCDFMESIERTTTAKSYLEESQEKSEEAYIEQPEIGNVLEDEFSNDNNERTIQLNHDGQTQSLDSDLETDNSNNIFNLVPLDTQERKTLTDNELTDENQSDITCNLDSTPKETAKIKLGHLQISHNEEIVPHIKAISSLSETLSSIRENVVRNLEHLKQPELFNTQDGVTEENVIKENVSNIGRDQVFNKDLTNLYHADHIAKETISDISMDDLQDMSNQLLDSNSKMKSDSSMNAAEFKIQSVDDFKSNEMDNVMYNDLLETTTNPTVIEKYQFNNKHTDDIETNASINSNENNIADKTNEGSLKSTSPSMNKKEMDTSASDTVSNTVPGILDLNSNLKLHTPLSENIIVQPSSDPLKLLGKPLGEALNLNSNLPTLDDLRERLANIFNPNDGSSEDYSSSLESDSTKDVPIEEMAPEASTTNSQIKLPSLKQLENINADIFQGKPRKITPFSDSSKTPRPNLNYYRAKVSVPSNLELKPVKTESNLGRTIGRMEIDRPLSIIGSETKESARKYKPSNMLTNPLETLDELRNTLQSNTKNLLSSPVHPDLNLFPENLHSNNLEDIAETIRLNTQKTIKGLQKKMKSSIRKTKTNTPLKNFPYHSSFVKPNELFDDVNDKLKAIHYDLNDRLASIHDDIIDPSRFNVLDLPRKSKNSNVMTNLKQNKVGRPSRLQTSPSTISTQEIDPHRNNFQQRDFILGKAGRSNFDPVWNNLPKNPIATESASSKNIDDVTLSENYPSLSHFHKMAPLNLNPSIAPLIKERLPLSDLAKPSTNLADAERLAFRTVRPLKAERQPNKVTITFGTTTARPVIPTQPELSSRPFYTESSQSDVHRPGIYSQLRKKPVNHKLKSAGDTTVSPSEYKLLRTSVPLPSSKNEEFQDNSSLEKNPMMTYKPRATVVREKPFSNTQNMENVRPNHSKIFADDKEERISDRESSFGWPKVNENSFLSKVRDAVNTRASSFDPTSARQLEMLRSPSENSDLVFNEPLKENVSYRCRMLCTKEYR